jgi:Uma2 family endonuclease
VYDVTTAPDLLARATRGPVRVSELPEDAEGVRYELIDGSLYVTPSADLDHQELCLELCDVLRHGLPDKLRVASAINVIRGDQTLVIPDVAVYDRDFAVRDGLGISPEGLLLAVEVTSTSTRRRDLSIKRDLYTEWSVPYAVVDRSVSPYSLNAYGSAMPAWVDLNDLRDLW